MSEERDTRRLGASDCERLRDGWLAQPVNAVTSLAYVGAGAAVAARCSEEFRRPAVGFAGMLALVGLGSVAFHGPQPRGARLAHDLPIVGALGLVAAIPVARLSRGHTPAPGWSARRGLALAGVASAAAAAYAGGRTGACTCDPDSPVQLHGAWHVLSAAGFVLVGDVLNRPVGR